MRSLASASLLGLCAALAVGCGGDGEDGAAGPAGADGIDGADGAPGADGTDGAPGTDGTDGADGADGAPGADGLSAGYSGVLPPWFSLYGRSIAEWGSEWWVWAYEAPVAINPVEDTTGEDCLVGQTREVFFLAGSFGGGPVVRDCTIPATQSFKPIVLPLANTAWDICGIPPADQISEAELRAGVEAAIGATTALEFTLDGVALGASLADFAAYRTPVTQFEYTVPDLDSLYDAWGMDFAGLCTPSFQSGYWVALAPLPAGAHTLQIVASQLMPDGSTFHVDATYNLTVQ